MLEKMEIEGVQLPTLYVATCDEDVKMAKSVGLPFVKWQAGAENLLRQMLRPALEKMFPHIKWDKVIGERKPFKTVVVEAGGGKVNNSEGHRKTDGSGDEEVADVAKERRWFSGKSGNDGIENVSLEKYMGDLSAYVNLEVLQSLNMLPTFLGDVVDCIKVNLMNQANWTEGYNKKLGLALGNFNGGKTLPNLIILDVSGSMPRGISATMLTLVDTMREQVQADLIITSSKSKFYPYGSKLPNPEDLRSEFGLANESYYFNEILEKNIRGKEWGHVISFGDMDTPTHDEPTLLKANGSSKPLGDTIVHHVHHYHTGLPGYCQRKEGQTFYTGYALWCTELTGCNPEVTVNTSWCNVIED